MLIETLFLLNQAWNMPGDLCAIRCKELFFGILHKILCTAQSGRVQENRSEIDGMIAFIHQFDKEHHSVESLAARCGMTAKSFSYMFNKHTRQFPINYLIRHRLDRAKQLLISSDYAIGVLRKASAIRMRIISEDYSKSTKAVRPVSTAVTPRIVLNFFDNSISSSNNPIDYNKIINENCYQYKFKGNRQLL